MGWAAWLLSCLRYWYWDSYSYLLRENYPIDKNPQPAVRAYRFAPGSPLTFDFQGNQLESPINWLDHEHRRKRNRTKQGQWIEPERKPYAGQRILIRSMLCAARVTRTVLSYRINDINLPRVYPRNDYHGDNYCGNPPNEWYGQSRSVNPKMSQMWKENPTQVEEGW